MQRVESTNNIKTVKNLEIVASSLPGAIYWKNKNGIYLGMNKFALQASGLKTFSNFIGKTDHDLWPRFANEIVENDQKVIQTAHTVEEEGAINLPNGEVRYYKATKVPLRDGKGNIVGVIGNYVDTTDIITAIKSASSSIETPIQLVSKHEHTHNITKMTNREVECIQLLKEGLSSKEIAAILNISKRTVEQYIDTAKNKLGCKNSVELVYKCFKNNILL